MFFNVHEIDFKKNDWYFIILQIRKKLFLNDLRLKISISEIYKIDLKMHKFLRELHTNKFAWYLFRF